MIPMHFPPKKINRHDINQQFWYWIFGNISFFLNAYTIWHFSHKPFKSPAPLLPKWVQLLVFVICSAAVQKKQSRLILNSQRNSKQDLALSCNSTQLIFLNCIFLSVWKIYNVTTTVYTSSCFLCFERGWNTQWDNIAFYGIPPFSFEIPTTSYKPYVFPYHIFLIPKTLTVPSTHKPSLFSSYFFLSLPLQFYFISILSSNHSQTVYLFLCCPHSSPQIHGSLLFWLLQKQKYFTFNGPENNTLHLSVYFDAFETSDFHSTFQSVAEWQVPQNNTRQKHQRFF